MSSYVLKIKGKRPENFIEFLLHLHINFRQLKGDKEYIIIEVSEEDYQKILKIKTSYEIEITKRKGIAYFLYLFKTKKLFLTALLFSFVLLCFLTRVTFSIEIIETDNDIKEMLLTDLKNLGIQKYHLKVGYQRKEKIRQQILEKEKEVLEWLEIEEVGTSYQIKLIKRVKKEEEKVLEPRHIIAKKDGMIVSIKADSGEVVTHKNMYVKQGDVLISGLIKNKEDIVSKVVAKGKVYAEVWYKINMNLPQTYKEEKKTGKKKQVLEVSFLNQSFGFNDLFPYKNAKEKVTILWYHPLLPLSIQYTKKEELEIHQVNYNNNTIKTDVIPLAKKKLKEKLGDEIEVISQKVLKKEQSAGKMNIELFFKVKENITAYQSIKEVDIHADDAADSKEE